VVLSVEKLSTVVFIIVNGYVILDLATHALMLFIKAVIVESSTMLKDSVELVRMILLLVVSFLVMQFVTNCSPVASIVALVNAIRDHVFLVLWLQPLSLLVLVANREWLTCFVSVAFLLANLAMNPCLFVVKSATNRGRIVLIVVKLSVMKAHARLAKCRLR